MKKRPWMPWYWADYHRGTQQFTNATEHGAYMLLLGYCWNNGKLPADDDQRRRIAKCTARQWRAIRDLVMSKFDNEGSNERCNEELAKVIEISSKRSAIALQMHNKRSAIAGGLHTHSHTHTHKNNSDVNLHLKKKETTSDGFIAQPSSKEFQAWKQWAFEKKKALWRELKLCEECGRSFNFETEWPPL